MVGNAAETSAGARVLLIEEDPVSRRLVERILHGREVISVAQGHLGLELARAQRPDLVVVGMDLLDITGEALVRRLREEPETAGVPVVILGADSGPSPRDGLAAAGAVAMLSKPLDVRKLRRTVDKILDGNSDSIEFDGRGELPGRGGDAR